MGITYKLDQLLTVKEFAVRMSVKLRTVRSWIYKRAIPFTRFERRVYFSSTVVEELLERNAIPALRPDNSPDSKPTGQGGEDKSKGVSK